MAENLVDFCADILDKAWGDVVAKAEAGNLDEPSVDKKLAAAIRQAINSTTKTYRYVLPTQLTAKLADHRLDSRCLQATRSGRGAFDARTIAHQVIVPFDQANHDVLGGSPEPYVNNPLRVPEISASYRAAQKNKTDWDLLVRVLSEVEKKNTRKFTRLIFFQTLIEIYRRLSTTRVSYPAPRRISLDNTMDLLNTFLASHSGGDRLLAVTASLFVIIGQRFRLYADVRRRTITTADRPAGMLADLECVAENGEIVIAVEVKDRQLTISQLRTKIPEMRKRRISEIFSSLSTE